MTRTLITLAILVALCLPALGADADMLKHGQFEMALQPADNSFLPASITWVDGGNVEVLSGDLALSHAFTSFEGRTKVYYNDNRKVWAGQTDPRFNMDVKVSSKRVFKREGWIDHVVVFENDYATVQRSILFHDTEPRISIEYHFVTTREMLIHEVAMFGVTMRPAAGFSAMSMYDARAENPTLLTVTDLKTPGVTRTLLYPGPRLFTNPEKKVSMLVTGASMGDIPRPVPTQRLTLPKDTRFSILTELTLAPADNDAQMQAMAENQAAVADDARAYLYYANAQMLMLQKKATEAEEALLKAGALKSDWAAPYGTLAGVRRDTAAGQSGQVDAWVEAAWRMPYNYGYILSGGGITGDKRLTEEQRRLAIFNMLIAVENTQFYADYYAWAARPFERMGMLAQACAVYRQALWALEHTPRSDDYKKKIRARFEKKLAELEKQLLSGANPDLPPLLPTRPE